MDHEGTVSQVYHSVEYERERRSRKLTTVKVDPTAANQIAPSSYKGYYANSSLRPAPQLYLAPAIATEDQRTVTRSQG